MPIWLKMKLVWPKFISILVEDKEEEEVEKKNNRIEKIEMT